MPHGTQRSPVPHLSPVQQIRFPEQGLFALQHGCGSNSVPPPQGSHPMAVLLNPDGQSVLQIPFVQPNRHVCVVCCAH
jgi:hypothetical protein